MAAQNTSMNIYLLDSSKTQVQKAMKFINVLLDKDIVKGKITAQDKVAILAKIIPTHDMKDFANVDFVVEVHFR